METLTIILAIIILIAALAIRYYQVRLKHAINHWQFERGKHEEYRNAYYSKGDELEAEKELHDTANTVKNHAINKAVEANKLVLELQETNVMLTLERNELQFQLDSANKGNQDLQDSLETTKSQLEVKNMQKLQTEKQLQELGIKYTQQEKALNKANETIKEVHKLLDSGAKGKETMAALLITGEYLKVQKNN